MASAKKQRNKKESNQLFHVVIWLIEEEVSRRQLLKARLLPPRLPPTPLLKEVMNQLTFSRLLLRPELVGSVEQEPVAELQTFFLVCKLALVPVQVPLLEVWAISTSFD